MLDQSALLAELSRVVADALGRLSSQRAKRTGRPPMPFTSLSAVFEELADPDRDKPGITLNVLRFLGPVNGTDRRGLSISFALSALPPREETCIGPSQCGTTSYPGCGRLFIRGNDTERLYVPPFGVEPEVKAIAFTCRECRGEPVDTTRPTPEAA